MASVENQVDIAIVGGGIVSATLATLLAELQGDLTIQVFERLPHVAGESTEAMNNAGTGHAANCELNYTPEKPDGSVDIAKALNINGAFEVSLQFWSHLVERGILAPADFLTRCPHLSFVWGEANTRFLQTRQALLSAHPMFQAMRFTRDRAELTEWMPLVMEGRETATPLAATRMDRGTDLDFGSLARAMFRSLAPNPGFQLHVDHEVRDLKRAPDQRWRLKVRDKAAGRTREVLARFVFLGAGGGALPLILKAGIPESHGYGGFPVSGQWLVCNNPEIVARHRTKVYGKATVGAPPMSVPHLDTRMIGGKAALLFGPYAGFTTKYLKAGSYLDLPNAVHSSNCWPMLAAAWHNVDLTRYLIGQVLQSPEDRVKTLLDFVPTARTGDWDLAIAGQRVQLIKKDPKLGGRLEFGTEMVAAADGSLAALLGASPGASTCASTMVDLILRCFPTQARSEAWQATLRRIVPSFGHDLVKEVDVLKSVQDRSNAILGLG